MNLSPLPTKAMLLGAAGRIAKEWNDFFLSMTTMLSIDNFYRRKNEAPVTSGITAVTKVLDYSTVNGITAVSIKFKSAPVVMAAGSTMTMPKESINQVIGYIYNQSGIQQGTVKINGLLMEFPEITGENELTVNMVYLAKEG
jgi:hypothetical protein